MATRLPYYVGGDDIYTQLMRQFESEVPYYSAAPAGIAGGYDPSLYSRLMPTPSGGEFTGDYSGLLGGGGDFGMQAPTTSTTGTGFSFGGLLGGGPSSTAAPGTVSTGLGGVSLSPAGTVTANTVSVPSAIGLGLITGLPLGLIAATMTNQSAQQAANALSTSLADTMGINATPAPGNAPSAAATAGPGGTGGAAAAAAAAAASAAAAAGMSDAAQGAAAQAAANAVVSGMTAAEAAQAGASAAAATTTGEVGIAGLATGFTDGGTAGGDASGIAGLSTGFSDSGAIGGNADSGIGIGGDGGGGGGGGGKIICTKLHELGKMPTKIYEADQAFGAKLVQNDPQAYYGYACWAQHVVRWMSREDLFGKFVVFAAYHIATPWSKAMAQEMGVDVKSGWFGRFLMKHGLKVCRAIGEMKQDRSMQNV